MEIEKRSQQAKVLRMFRKVHRTMGMFLFILFLFVSITGLMLGWKKNSGGLILPESFEGTSTDLEDWISIDSLHKNAIAVLLDSISPELSTELERIDIRPDKGMVKFVFIENYIGIQLDGATGKLLHIESRRSDFIENVHDGSILDYFFKTDKEQIKLIYTTITGLSLLTFTISGFWLWYGPKRMRRKL